MDTLILSQSFSSGASSEPPAAKRRKPEPSTKVCFICCCDADPDSGYYIYIIDFGNYWEVGDCDPRSVGFSSRAPMLRIGGGWFEEAFCVLGSTLYMFEAYHPESNPCGKSVFKCDLSSFDLTGNLKLEKRDGKLVEAAPMLHTKNNPIALPTPDGKRIVVFSTRIFLGGSYADRIDFEIYDLHSNSCSKLPGISPQMFYDHWRFHGDTVDLDTYTFLNESTLLVQTDFGLMLSLNLDSPDALGWKQDRSHFARLPINGGHCFMNGKGLCVTGSGIYEPDKRGGFRECSYFKSAFGDDYEDVAPLVYPLGNVAGNCFFCVGETATDISSGDYPCLITEVWRWNPEEYEQVEGQQPLEKYHVKSFRFLLDTYPCGFFFPVHLSTYRS